MDHLKPIPPQNIFPRPAFFGRHKKLVILAITLVLAVGGASAYIAFRKGGKNRGFTPEVTVNQELSEADKAAIEAGKQLSGGQCEGFGVNAKLSKSPMDPEDFSLVIPYGLMVGDHVTPIDHQYFSPKDYNSPRDAYEVYAMADGHITSIGLREKPEGGHAGGNEYRMVFTQTCTFQYYYDLVTSLAPDLNKAFDESRGGRYYTNDRFNYEVKAGQLIGYIGGRTLDFAVWDTTKPLKGFITPDLYKSESWKLYTADPLEYYTDELKAIILPRYIRSVEPISGKIDYDIDGRLVGNWFLEGTNGYAGNTEAGGPGAANSHLAFAPEHLDPSYFVVSMGDYGGTNSQFITKTNSPDPKDVSAATGVVKYELVEINYKKPDGSFWDRKSTASDLKITPNQFIKGVVLVQMLEDRKIKFEAFPNKKASQVSGFTSAAKIYIR